MEDTMIVIFPDRPYQILFEHRPDYLFVYVGSDVNSLEIAAGYWIDILSVVDERNYKQVLIEKDVTQRLPSHQVFHLISRLAHTGHHSDVKFAMWDHHYDRERTEFKELVASNRGFNLKIVPTLTEAEMWLSNKQRNLPTRKSERFIDVTGWSAAA
jgi:hypothetical protein